MKLVFFVCLTFYCLSLILHWHLTRNWCTFHCLSRSVFLSVLTTIHSLCPFIGFTFSWRLPRFRVLVLTLASPFQRLPQYCPPSGLLSISSSLLATVQYIFCRACSPRYDAYCLAYPFVTVFSPLYHCTQTLPSPELSFPCHNMFWSAQSVFSYPR